MSLPVAPIEMPSELAGQSNGLLPANFLYSVAGGFLLKNASIAFNAMNEEATAAGYPLTTSTANNTYRRLSVQDTYFYERYDHMPRFNTGGVVWYRGLPWWRKPGATTAAVPGTSNHGWGLAYDVLNAIGGRLAWLLANAGRFGFSWEIQSEPWHIRYVLGDELPFFFPPAPQPIPIPPAPTPQTKDFDVSTTVYLPTSRPGRPADNPVYDFTWLRANGESVGNGYIVLSQLFLRQYVRDDPPRDKIITVWFGGVAVPVSVTGNGLTAVVDVQHGGLCSVGDWPPGQQTDSAQGIWAEARETILPR